MARQKGVIKLTGQIGDISFYKTADGGYLARQKGGIDGKRIKNDPAFIRTRENGEEFGRAGAASKLLRTAFRAVILKASDSLMTSRLTREMVKVIQADLTNPRGKRNVIDGEAALLQGFEFNLNATLGSTFFAPYSIALNRVAGSIVANIPGFVPGSMITAPQGTTHCKITLTGAEVDFEGSGYLVNTQERAEIELGPAELPDIILTTPVTPNSTKPIFIALGIEFFQRVNGRMYSLNNGAFNALSLVNVDGGV